MRNMPKIAILLTLLSNILFSNINYTELYMKEGIDAVEKILSKKLQNKKYWDKQLANKNLANGYYQSLKYVLVCNKDMSNINIYDSNNNELYKSSVLLGELEGSKVKEGDLKTPIGAYKLLQKLNQVDPFYGPFALTTNYPNKFDKSLGKTGSGIWIHGVPFKQKRKPFTKGCIALTNENLESLKNKIKLKESVLIISDKKNTLTNNKQIASILSSIFIWRDAWKYGDFAKYLSFYSKEFKNSKGKGYQSFKNYKQRIFAKNEKKSIILKDINIIPYPNDLNKTMFKISMHENYRTKNYKFVGKKELFVELVNNKMKILFE
jgi:murein L,D-transpeptidase YafK